MENKHRLGLRVSDKVKAQWEKVAEEEGLSLSAWVRMLAVREVARHKAAKKKAGA